MEKIRLVINGKEIEAESGRRLIEIALENGIYVPNLCYHPDLPPPNSVNGRNEVYRGSERIEGVETQYEGCGICVVQVNGRTLKSCEYIPQDGDEIFTDSEDLRAERKRKLAEILANHPHVCITCEYRNGCDRIQCSFGNPPEERCCDLFPVCELRHLAEYIGVDVQTPRYHFRNLPVVEEKLYRWDWNYCINCTRCVRGCITIREANALGFTFVEGAYIVGRTGESDVASGCKFCGVCVEVCPTGVVRDRKVKQRNRWRDSISEKILAPLRQAIPLNQENLENVPESAGVFRLYDENMEVVYIKGTENLRQSLMEELGNAEFFDYEESEMFTIRESELIQEFLQKYGRLPKMNDEMDDLFDI